VELEVSKIRQGLIDPKDLEYRRHDQRPLMEHLADYHGYLLHKGNTAHHAKLARARCGHLITEGRLERISNLNVASVQAALKLVKEKRGLSQRTVAHYTIQFKAFASWLCRTGRAREEVLA
jgi:hypothetical protein